jgi:hypothetical protein
LAGRRTIVTSSTNTLENPRDTSGDRLSREHFHGVHHFGREATKPDKQRSIDIATALRVSAIAP